MGDLTRMRAQCEKPLFLGEEFHLEGEARFEALSGYQEDFAALTHGRGALTWQLSHYAPCQEQERVVRERGYQPLRDDPPDSVFCAKGAGFTVAWDRVREFAHCQSECLTHGKA